MITKAYKKVNFERFKVNTKDPSSIMDREVYIITPRFFDETVHIGCQLVLSWPETTHWEIINNATAVMLRNGWEEVPVDSLGVKGEKPAGDGGLSLDAAGYMNRLGI